MAGGLILFALLIPNTPAEAMAKVSIFVIFAVMIMLVVNYTRTLIERDYHAALQHSETHLRLVMENMPALLVAFDDALKVQFWNQECERTTGYFAADIIGKPQAVQAILPSSLSPEDASTLQIGNNYRGVEISITCKDESEKIISWSNISESYPIPGWNHWAVGIDITERRRAEEQKLALALSQQRIDLLRNLVTKISDRLKKSADDHQYQRLSTGA